MTEEANKGGGDPNKPNGGEPASGSENQQQMIKRVIGQRDTARENANVQEDINRDLLERNKKLEREMEILRKATGQKPDDKGGDGGGSGSEASQKGGDAPDVKQIVREALQEQAEAQDSEQKQEKFKKNIDAHYDRASKLGHSDYEQAEANALRLLGTELVEGITNMLPNSEKVLYMLGSDESEAKRLAQLFAKDPTAATIETGRISAKAETYVKNNAADPEDELEAGGATTNQLAVLEKQLDKAYDKAAENGDLTEVTKIKKKIKALKAKQA